MDKEEIADDPLRLVFTCSHRVAADRSAKWRSPCAGRASLTTEEIARAFLRRRRRQRIAQRHRSRHRQDPRCGGSRTGSRAAAGPRADRLDSVLRVIYLVFNEGYSASSGTALTRADLSAEAIRLGRLVAGLLPDPEAMGLLALNVAEASRARRARRQAAIWCSSRPQDRGLWDRALIDGRLGSGRARPRAGAGARASARRPAPEPTRPPWAAIRRRPITPARCRSGQRATDGPQIVGPWPRPSLRIAEPSPVVALNRAVAVAMRDGPAAGLPLIETVLADGQLQDYHLAHAARADICRRLGRHADARASYERALALVRQEPEREFLAARLRDLPT